MLINLSNHPYKNWDEKQKLEAERLFFSVVDIEFPKIFPEAELSDVIELASTYLKKINEILKAHNGKKIAVHLMGEFTFTYNLIELLRVNSITVIASTTVREIFEDENGKKISKFTFVRFRNYF